MGDIKNSRAAGVNTIAALFMFKRATFGGKVTRLNLCDKIRGHKAILAALFDVVPV